MALASPAPGRIPTQPASSGSLPAVRLEIRQGSSRSTTYDVSEVGFLIGSVAGCDLRLPGRDLPPVICLIGRHTSGASIRKLVPTQAVLVNGQPLSGSRLAAGDRVSVAGIEITVAIASAPDGAAPVVRFQSLEPFEGDVALRRRELDDLARELQERQHHLEEQSQELETDRVIWYERREQIEREYRERSEAVAALKQELEAATSVLSDIARREQLLADNGARLVEAQQELARSRQELQDRYRERRDRLAGLQEAVNHAARKVQEAKQNLEADRKDLAERQQQEAERGHVLARQTAELERQRAALEEQQRGLAARESELQRGLAGKAAEYEALTQQLVKDRAALEQEQRQYQADLVRLHRAQADLEQRNQQLLDRAREVDQHIEENQQTDRALAERCRQLEEARETLHIEREQCAAQTAELEGARAQLDQRFAALEGQQTMLATLRARLERMREDLRRDQQQAAEQRAHLESREAGLEQRVLETERLRAELDRESQQREEEQRRYAERSTLMETAMARLRQVQENLAAEEERARQRVLDLNAAANAQAEEASLLGARAAQLLEQQQRLAADRKAFREREAVLVQAEQAREALQEQLRRRSEELASRQKALSEQARQLAEATAAVELRRAEVERSHEQAEERFAERGQELERRAAEFERLHAALSQREETLRGQVERLKQAGRHIAAERKTLSEERAGWQAAQDEAAVLAQRRLAELAAAREELREAQAQLPELELRALAAVDRLAAAREQLRAHLAELHAYARQGEEGLETLRAQIQAEGEQVRQQELALRRAREDHRLGVAAFRQQLIEWQGQVAEMKRSLAQGETRLERRQAQVEAQVRQIDATTVRLAQQAEHIQEQERVVAERRQEMERHLADMREWYRQKLRELTERRREGLPGGPGLGASPSTAPPHPPAPGEGDPDTPDILMLTPEVEPGDRQLGELLRSLELVDSETLTALLVEARKQRRSLRQLLLAGGYLTIYQMALIEAGNLDGLVLGPVRLVDRLQATARETIYRVFDPRRGVEAVLRHLAESEMEHAVHPDEFRQRFAQAAAVRHTHLAATLEVLEINGRPAVLQEWLTGLPGTDWPALTAAPGVSFRLLNQAALGLHAAHEAGLTHGHLHAGLFVLTAEGVLKLCGFGEPLWLSGTVAVPDADEAAADLRALGQAAAGWSVVPSQREGARRKPLPKALQAIVDRLCSADAAGAYPTAAALLEDLEQASGAVPANGEAWKRLLKHVHEHGLGDACLRQSA